MDRARLQILGAMLFLLAGGAAAVALAHLVPVLDVFSSLYWVRFENDLNRPVVVQWRVSECGQAAPESTCFAPVRPEALAPGSTLGTSLPGEEGLPTMYRLVETDGVEIGCVWLDENTEPNPSGRAQTIEASAARPCPPGLTAVASPGPRSAPLVGGGPPRNR